MLSVRRALAADRTIVGVRYDFVRGWALLLTLVLAGVFGLTTSATADDTTQPPGQLQASSADNASFDASWQPVKGAEHYKIQYATSADFATGSYAWSDDTRIRIDGLAPSTTVWARVRVVDSANLALSDYSAAVSVTTNAASDRPVPTGLRVVATNSSTVSLGWDATTPGARYRVAYAGDKALTDPTRVETGTNSILIDKLKPGLAYWFAVQQVAGEGGSSYSAPLKVRTSGAAVMTATRPVQVASYNIRCANCSKGELVNEERPWAERKAAVAAMIKSRDLDVVGIQEASQGWLRNANGSKYEKSQFEDLIEALGAPWALTDDSRNNCVKSSTPNNCRYANQGASQGTKIIYNTDRLSLVSSGSRLLSTASSSSNTRYLAWAVLEQKDTKDRFFFADTHLDHEDDSPGSNLYYDLRRAQAGEVVEEIRRQNAKQLPAVLVGDMNSSKYTAPSNAPYDIFVASGFVDPLGNTYRSTSTAPGATVEKRINTNLDSFNNFERTPGRKSGINGTYIDYILTTPMRVSEWETVVNTDGNGRFIGVIPSDHNLIRATVWLPAP